MTDYTTYELSIAREYIVDPWDAKSRWYQHATNQETAEILHQAEALPLHKIVEALAHGLSRVSTSNPMFNLLHRLYNPSFPTKDLQKLLPRLSGLTSAVAKALLEDRRNYVKEFGFTIFLSEHVHNEAGCEREIVEALASLPEAHRAFSEVIDWSKQNAANSRCFFRSAQLLLSAYRSQPY